MPLKVDYPDSLPAWMEINDPIEIEGIMDQFGYFHDSCLRDFHLSTSAFVNHNLSMTLDNEITAVLLFQRQFNTNAVLELKFLDVVGFNYQPPPKNYNEVIYDAVFERLGGVYYWADNQEWTLSGFQNGDVESVWIGGRKLYYRWRPELLGNVARFPE